MVLRSEILVNKNVLPTAEQALPGRETPMNLPETHFVNGNPLLGPFMDDVGFAIFGLGCFWGAERKFWQRDGVVSTVVGYAGGFTPNPTQGMRQGNDIGSQYRSVIYATTPEQLDAAKASAQAYQEELTKAGLGEITTEIDQAPTVYFAEAYHQQYLAKNPQGYCGIGGTGVTCPI